MFGFHRIRDLIWALETRGSRVPDGGHSGRTTLAGRGPPTCDGYSHLAAATVPSCQAYDPAFAYELAVIVRDGYAACSTRPEDIFVYMTLYNENYAMPSMPDGAESGILAASTAIGRRRERTASPQILAMAPRFRRAGGSTPSGRRARCGGRRVERDQLQRCATKRSLLSGGTGFTHRSATAFATRRRSRRAAGPIVAVTDFVKAVPDQIGRGPNAVRPARYRRFWPLRHSPRAAPALRNRRRPRRGRGALPGLFQQGDIKAENVIDAMRPIRHRHRGPRPPSTRDATAQLEDTTPPTGGDPQCGKRMWIIGGTARRPGSRTRSPRADRAGRRLELARPRQRIEDIEGERLLENEARGRLEADGFTDRARCLRWVRGVLRCPPRRRRRGSHRAGPSGTGSTPKENATHGTHHHRLRRQPGRAQRVEVGECSTRCATRANWSSSTSSPPRGNGNSPPSR